MGEIGRDGAEQPASLGEGAAAFASMGRGGAEAVPASTEASDVDDKVEISVDGGAMKIEVSKAKVNALPPEEKEAVLRTFSRLALGTELNDDDHVNLGKVGVTISAPSEDGSGREQFTVAGPDVALHEQVPDKE